MSDGEGRRALTVGVAFGLLAGLGEGIGLYVAQESGRSRWPILFGTGPGVMWLAPLVDAVLFALLAGVVVLGAKLLRRRSSLAAVVAVCSLALAADWSRVTNELPRRHALAIGVAAAIAGALLARRREAAVARAARLGVLVLGGATLLLALAVELRGPLVERRIEAKLPPAPAGAPDVLIVVLDTVRADDLSAFGAARRTSPNLERIAAEGTRFDACWSTSSWTLPAHASLLTGRLPWEHGAALEPLDAKWPMLSEELAAHGWRTGAFSGNLCFFQRGFGFGRGFHHFDDFDWSWRARLASTLPVRELIDRAGAKSRDLLMRKPARVVSDAYLAWLDRSQRPSFAVLNWFDAHCPYHPPEEFQGRFAGDGLDRVIETSFGDPRVIARDRQAYHECLLALDAELGRLCEELRRRGRLDRTLLVVVSDHGEAFGEHEMRYHRGALYREQAQVPLVLRAPGLVPAGATVGAVASIASLPATIVGLLGLEAGAFPGPSLAPLWTGEGEDDPAALLELARHPWGEYKRRECNDGALRSIVRGRWHYIWHEKRGSRLFDLQEDPQELRDVKDDHSDVAEALDLQLRQELESRQRHPREPSTLDLASHPELAGIGYAAGGH